MASLLLIIVVTNSNDLCNVCRQLREGSLEENQLVDGSRLTLLPSVETGLLVSIYLFLTTIIINNY